ncbi:protein xpaC [Bacillus sp. V3-13]|uniref:5-bromo-4-chloroindolyl phosphate hydrolysis family protein n=1 Tax=Bacillus sp. V3-13 TaxID=2053728 RepID=UPI000C7676C7|nr:5-bromo-4-chloroindolyl phosphate hydrolysis family protein [Bacillus sp. V3-13]PLR77822.1 protein xpaC [Bacillus sp. V3-13]
MNPFLSFILYWMLLFPITVFVWLISFVVFDQTFWLSVVYSLASAFLVFIIVKSSLKSRFLKKHQLGRKEYKYIKKNLDEAKTKIKRLRKAFFQVRDIASFRQTFETLRITKRIYTITKKEPKRFYQAEQFYYSHLDSIVELAEKYAFLSAQPNKKPELAVTLRDTRTALKELSMTIEEDLNQVLSNDIDSLNYELDVVKYTINPRHEDGRRL